MPQYDRERALILPADYRRWILAGSSLGLSYAEGAPTHPTFHETLIEPTAYEYLVRTGQFREGTMLALIVHEPEEAAAPSKHGQYAAAVQAVEMAVKDKTRVAEGWCVLRIRTGTACGGCDCAAESRQQLLQLPREERRAGQRLHAVLFAAVSSGSARELNRNHLTRNADVVVLETADHHERKQIALQSEHDVLLRTIVMLATQARADVGILHAVPDCLHMVVWFSGQQMFEVVAAALVFDGRPNAFEAHSHNRDLRVAAADQCIDVGAIADVGGGGGRRHVAPEHHELRVRCRGEDALRARGRPRGHAAAAEERFPL